jgi:hypothetical protein
MSAQIERGRHTEILWRLNRYPVVACSVPNGLWIPARTEAERTLVARIINRMKSDGMLTPGAPDLVIAGTRGALMCELKRPPTADLFTKRPKGRLSPEQKTFRDACAAAGVRYVVAYDWDDVEPELDGLF